MSHWVNSHPGPPNYAVVKVLPCGEIQQGLFEFFDDAWSMCCHLIMTTGEKFLVVFV